MDSSIKTLGSIIRKVRKEQGLTQQQLASVCGVGVRFLREIELGKETSQIGLVFKVVYMLGLEIKIGNVQL